MSCFASVTSYAALKYAPLGLSSILFNLHPIIASVLAALIMKQVIGQLNYFMMICAFLGVVLINLGSSSAVSN